MTAYRRSYSEIVSPWDLASARNHSRAGSVSVIRRLSRGHAYLGSPRDLRLDELRILHDALHRQEHGVAVEAAMAAQERAIIELLKLSLRPGGTDDFRAVGATGRTADGAAPTHRYRRPRSVPATITRSAAASGPAGAGASAASAAAIAIP